MVCLSVRPSVRPCVSPTVHPFSTFVDRSSKCCVTCLALQVLIVESTKFTEILISHAPVVSRVD